jgi:hypothetical protein
MFSRITRLELIIVVAALLLLVFFTRPPTSGSADIRQTDPLPAGQMSQDAQPTTGQPQPSGVPSSPAGVDTSATAAPTDIGTSDSDGAALAVPPPPKVKRIGMVDARNCTNLKYKDVMYGEVTVQWVWNGQKFEARKVLEVKEANGVTSIWTFDENDNIITTELRAEQAPGN